MSLLFWPLADVEPEVVISFAVRVGDFDVKHEGTRVARKRVQHKVIGQQSLLADERAAIAAVLRYRNRGGPWTLEVELRDATGNRQNSLDRGFGRAANAHGFVLRTLNANVDRDGIIRAACDNRHNRIHRHAGDA